MIGMTAPHPDWIEADMDNGCLTLNIGRSTLNESEGTELTEYLRNPGGQHVVLNLEKVTLITSPAIGALIVIHKRLSNNKQKLVLANLSTLLEEAMGFLMLDRVFTICQGPEAVNKAIRGH